MTTPLKDDKTIRNSSLKRISEDTQDAHIYRLAHIVDELNDRIAALERTNAQRSDIRIGSDGYEQPDGAMEDSR